MWHLYLTPPRVYSAVRPGTSPLPLPPLGRIEQIGNALDVDFDAIGRNAVRPETREMTPAFRGKLEFLRGIEVELEHGRRDERTNVTDDDLVLTAKIALAHFAEYLDYYVRLDEMQAQAKRAWEGRENPGPFRRPPSG